MIIGHLFHTQVFLLILFLHPFQLLEQNFYLICLLLIEFSLIYFPTHIQLFSQEFLFLEVVVHHIYPQIHLFFLIFHQTYHQNQVYFNFDIVRILLSLKLFYHLFPKNLVCSNTPFYHHSKAIFTNKFAYRLIYLIFLHMYFWEPQVFIGIFLSLNFFLIQILAFIVRQILVFLIQFQVFLQIQVFLRIQVFLIQIQAFPIQIQVFLIQILVFLVLILVFLILVLNFQFLVFQLLDQIFLLPYRILNFIQNLVYLNQVFLDQIQAFLM